VFSTAGVLPGIADVVRVAFKNYISFSSYYKGSGPMKVVSDPPNGPVSTWKRKRPYANL
jgi:hypothetical protein